MKVLLQDIKKLETEAIIVGFFEDVRPLKGVAGELDWLLCGSLSSLIINKKLRGVLGDVALLTSQGKLPTQKIFMIGLGRSGDLTPSILRSAAKNAALSALGAGVTKVAIDFFLPTSMPYDSSMAAFSEGLSQGADGRHFEVSLLAPDATTYEKIAHVLRQ
ncbi:MAG TPA: M17 family peptidase N-terminal domain-containing protein [Nitrospirota bacterium]|nr:M17 family peptidase N-terminal domain-containing protein [Nitrospirota bacterium]